MDEIKPFYQTPFKFMEYVDLDEGPLELRKDFCIYKKDKDSVLFIQFGCPERCETPNDLEKLRRSPKHISVIFTYGDAEKESRAESGLRNYCKSNNMNLIQVSDISGWIDIAEKHLKEFYRIDS